MADNQGNLSVDTVKQILQYNAVRNPAAPAFLLRDENGEKSRISYRRLFNSVNRLGTALLRRGLCGGAIAVIGKNSAGWAIAFLACVSGAGVAVPVDREMTAESMLHLIRFAEIKAVFADAAAQKKLSMVQKKLPRKLHLFSLEQTDDRFETVWQLMEEGQEALEEGNDAFWQQNVDPDAPAAVLFTSGTTDNAKAVMLSNRNLCSDVMLVADRVLITASDSTLCVLPMHHAYQLICFLTMLYAGGCVSFCEGLRHISQDLLFFAPSLFVTVPLMLEKMHKRIFERLEKQSGIKRVFSTGRLSILLERFELTDFRKFIYSLIHEAFGGNLRMILCGAAPLNPDIARDFLSFGLPVVIGYGLTECSPIVMCNSGSHPRCDSVGRPLEGVSVMLNQPDESGRGEIFVKGPIVMLGYYKNKKATAEVLKDGWFHTGDLAYCDDEGNYHITGRSKNVIVTKGGKNIYPEELEAYLNNDPLVLESLIFGEIADGDETVAAQVVPDEDAIKEQTGKQQLSAEDLQRAVSDVIARINRLVPSYKTIRRVLIRREELEKSALQKVRRKSDLNQSDDHDSKENDNA